MIDCGVYNVRTSDKTCAKRRIDELADALLELRLCVDENCHYALEIWTKNQRLIDFPL